MPEASSDPAKIFWDDLTAANRLKTYLLSSGIDVAKEVIQSLSKLTSQYDPDAEEPRLQSIAQQVEALSALGRKAEKEIAPRAVSRRIRL